MQPKGTLQEQPDSLELPATVDVLEIPLALTDYAEMIELIASFLDAGEIDEFDIHVMPVFIGEGIPLVAPRHRDITLNLISARKYSDGVVRLRYSI